MYLHNINKLVHVPTMVNKCYERTMEHIFTHYKSFNSNFTKKSGQNKIFNDVKFVANAIKSSKTPNLLKLIGKQTIYNYS